MKTRIVTGVIAAVLLVLLLSFGSFGLMLTAVLACAVLAYLEFDRMFFGATVISRQLVHATLLILMIISIRQDMTIAFFGIFGFLAAVAVYHVYACSNEEDFDKVLKDISIHLVGFLYIVSLFGFLVPIAEWPDNGRNYLLLLFLWVFIGDTTAYFVGKYFGKTRLSPGISPKKTIEGAIGALLSSIVVSLVWLQFICDTDWDKQYAFRIILFAPVASVLAQMGDLFESILKRSRAQKDSGSFLPGHGGILDRVDGLAFTSPAFYAFLQYILESTS